jgi:hypothetical protein
VTDRAALVRDDRHRVRVVRVLGLSLEADLLEDPQIERRLASLVED